MYFIAFFLQKKKHYVIPYSWVRGISYENIINNSLNRNKQVYAFYTNNPDAFEANGVPKTSHIPNQNARGRVFHEDGWYKCKLRKFKVDTDEALAYNDRRRNIGPAVYTRPHKRSKRRKRNRRHSGHVNSEHSAVSPGQMNLLRTSLVANTSANASVNECDSLQMSGKRARETEENEENRSSSRSSELVVIQIDTPNVQPSVGPIVQPDETVNIAVDVSVDVSPPGTANLSANLEIKQEPEHRPYYCPHRTNSRALSDGIERRISIESSIESSNTPRSDADHPAPAPANTNSNASLDDDSDHDPDACVIIDGDTKFPKPLYATSNGLIKYENEEVSGDKSFGKTRNGRLYEIGNKLIEIREDVVDRLKLWNQTNQQEDDNPFALAILLSIITPEELANNTIGEEAIHFICDLLRYRTNNNKNRVEAAVDAIREYCRVNSKC